MIASGGISSLAGFLALRGTGVIADAISGRAPYDGAIDLTAALVALRIPDAGDLGFQIIFCPETSH